MTLNDISRGKIPAAPQLLRPLLLFIHDHAQSRHWRSDQPDKGSIKQLVRETQTLKLVPSTISTPHGAVIRKDCWLDLAQAWRLDTGLAA